MEEVIVDAPFAEEILVDEPTVEVSVEPELDEERLDSDIEYQREIIDELVDAMNELEEKNEELGTNVAEKDKSLVALSEELTTLNTKISTLSETLTEFEKMKSNMSKIEQHEIVGSIAKALLDGREVNIPKYLENYVVNELKALPQFTSEPIAQVTNIKKQETLNSLLKRYDDRISLNK